MGVGVFWFGGRRNRGRQGGAGGGYRSGTGNGAGTSRGLAVKGAVTRLVANFSVAETGPGSAKAVTFGIGKGS